MLALTIRVRRRLSESKPERSRPRPRRRGPVRVGQTDANAEANPDWSLDLSDEEIGYWRGPHGHQGTVTLVWGVAGRGRRTGAPRSVCCSDLRTGLCA